MNQGNTNLTMEMAEATFPIMTIVKDGMEYNELHGYVQEMDVSFQRDTITEIGENRELQIKINTFGESIKEILFEVRSLDGSRLIENTRISEYEESDNSIKIHTSVKDLIEKDTEYNMIFYITMDSGTVIQYYTRIIWSAETYAAEKIAFVEDFHNKTFDKEEAAELTAYLESNSTGDNTTFYKVDIHSSLNQITWGDLGVTRLGEPVIKLMELASQTASLELNYMVSTSTESNVTAENSSYYYVEEFYRIRYTPERVYLLTFERTMTQIPQVKGNIYSNNKILLGITEEDVECIESQDGNVVVFQVADTLYSYNISTNKVAILFSFQNGKYMDSRYYYNQHDIKILDIDEGGNVKFAVYGYMNRGRHEGNVGVQINYYNSAQNTTEELIYIPYDKPYEILSAEVEKLLYLNRENELYFYLDNYIYQVNLEEKQYEIIAEMNSDEGVEISSSHKIVVWYQDSDIDSKSEMYIMNLATGIMKTIVADEGELIRPLGFMSEDIIYGQAKKEDIIIDAAGRIFFPMYKVVICDSQGELLKDYQQENIYTVECSVEENQINLDRVLRQEDGSYIQTTQEHIMNNTVSTEGKNTIVTVAVDIYGKITQLSVKNTINTKTLQVLTPKEVVFEGGRELEIGDTNEHNRYYVYSGGDISGIYLNPAQAINEAYDNAGVVVNQDGKTIWIRGNRAIRNQIMAIKENSITEEKNALAVCIDTVLEYEGVIRNSEYLLSQGQSVIDILQDNIEYIQVMDLDGCNLDAVLYYVNQDIPVLVALNNGDAVLVVGFNEFNVVIMDPVTGTLYKKGLNDSKTWFEENGNHFITYVRTE